MFSPLRIVSIPETVCNPMLEHLSKRKGDHELSPVDDQGVLTNAPPPFLRHTGPTMQTARFRHL
jgi:hypothetical protein